MASAHLVPPLRRTGTDSTHVWGGPLAVNARRIVDRSLLALWHACVEFVDDRGHRDAAQIALLRGALLRPAGDAAGRRLRARSSTTPRSAGGWSRRCSTTCPLSQDGDRARLERTVGDALDNAGRLGPISVAAADRRRQRRDGRAAPRDQPGVGHPHAPAAAAAQGARPRARARRGTLLVLSPRVHRDARGGGRWARAAGRSTSSATCCRSLFTVGVVLFLYRVLPSPRPKTREIWPGAVVAAAADQPHARRRSSSTSSTWPTSARSTARSAR